MSTRDTFGSHLIRRGLLTEEQLQKALALQKKDGAPSVGMLASRRHMLTREQITEIIERTSETDERFGEAAIKLGHLSSSQACRLLAAQNAAQRRLGTILVQMRILTAESAKAELELFHDGYKATVLVIDNSPEIRDILQKALTAAGFQVVEAEDSASGLIAAAKHHPDVITTDFEDAGDGLSLIKRLRATEAHHSTPIFVITGEGTEEAIAQIDGVGVEAVIAKPFQPTYIVAMLRECLRMKNA